MSKALRFLQVTAKHQDYSWFMTARRKGVTIKNIFIVFLLAIESTFFLKINLVKWWTFFVSLFISEYYYHNRNNTENNLDT